MVSGFCWAALVHLFGHLALFFRGSAIAARAAGRPVWLFARATGRDRLAAFAFRAAFALALFGPILWLAFPMLRKDDPLWIDGKELTFGLIGFFIAGLGAMVAFAARMSMGTFWRVGVVTGQTGSLVSGGLYQFSRNPTFVGQLTLLAGVSLTVPAVPTILAAILFLWSAATQVRSEEAALRQTLGSDYDRYAASVPRWMIVVLIAATALADQFSKAATLSKFALGQPVAVLPGLNLTLGFNEGSSFGLLSGVMTGNALLMAALTGAQTLIFAVMAFRVRHPLERGEFALVVGESL